MLGAGAFETAIDLTVHGVDEVLIDDSATDRRLVRDHDCREPRPLQQSQGVDRPWEQRQMVESIEVATLLEERAVAIEKNGAAAHGSGLAGSGFGIGVMQYRAGQSPSRALVRKKAVSCSDDPGDTHAAYMDGTRRG